MKGLTLPGAVLLVLRLLAFCCAPIPHSQNHGVKIADAMIVVQTEQSDRRPRPSRELASSLIAPCKLRN
jgi:hypothetical protein